MEDDPGRSLVDGERYIEFHGVPLVEYCRPGEPDKPLVLFLTGGGVLARVAYGHPGANTRDFIDYWLSQNGWGLIAPSYSSDHAIFERTDPHLTLAQWADVVAGIVAERTADQPGRRIVACGWSMGGRLAFALTRSLRLRGLSLACFVSLSATPPFPRLNAGPQPPERLLPTGFWDLSSGIREGTARDERWLGELAAIARTEGHDVIPPREFRSFYRMNVPPGLWGPEIEPFFAGTEPGNTADEFRGAASFSGEDYPVCAVVMPTDRQDYRHALADQAVWGSVTVRGLVNNRFSTAQLSRLSETEWTAIREAVIGVPQRLSRSICGGHFFFLGRGGAKASVGHIRDLLHEVDSLDALLDSVLPPPEKIE